MPNVPGKPQRKAAGRVGNTPFGAAKPRPNATPPRGKNARPFSSPSAESVGYRRKAVGINPGNHNIGRSAGDAAQPRNNPKSSSPRRGATQNMPNRRKGVD